MFDEDEIEVLALSLAEVRSWGDPALARAADSVLAKIAATLPDMRERQLLHAIAEVFRPEPRYAAALDLAPLRAGGGGRHPLCGRGRRWRCERTDDPAARAVLYRELRDRS